MNNSQHTFIEVCAGCGGLSSGFMEAGFRPLLINELDKTCCQTLRENHKGANIAEQSMLELDLTPYKGQVDILQGGVPCQAFSHAGERKGLDDPRGELIIRFNDLIKQCEPRMFLVENVKGLLTHHGGDTLRGVIELFRQDGTYNVHYKLLNAKDYSVPQKRERVVIIGVRSDHTKEWTYPPPSNAPKVLSDVLQNVPPSQGMRYSAQKEAVMRHVPPGGCWVNLPDEIKRAYMGEKCLSSGGGKRGIARRLSMDEQCLTLTTSPCQKQTERCHPEETRPFTIREYARIQTFPDTYQFKGSMANQYKQIGNAVPVQFACALARHIKQYLAEDVIETPLQPPA